MAETDMDLGWVLSRGGPPPESPWRGPRHAAPPDPPPETAPARMPVLAALPETCSWGWCTVDASNPWACRHIVMPAPAAEPALEAVGGPAPEPAPAPVLVTACDGSPASRGSSCGPRCPACTDWLMRRLGVTA